MQQEKLGLLPVYFVVFKNNCFGEKAVFPLFLWGGASSVMAGFGGGWPVWGLGVAQPAAEQRARGQLGLLPHASQRAPPGGHARGQWALPGGTGQRSGQMWECVFLKHQLWGRSRVRVLFGAQDVGLSKLQVLDLILCPASSLARDTRARARAAVACCHCWHEMVLVYPEFVRFTETSPDVSLASPRLRTIGSPLGAVAQPWRLWRHRPALSVGQPHSQWPPGAT